MERYLKPSSNRSRPPRDAGSSEAEYSDFPPIRKLDSSPPPPAITIHSQGHSQPLRVSSKEPIRGCRPSGLGGNSLVNIGPVGAGVVPAKRATNLKVMPILNQCTCCSMLISAGVNNRGVNLRKHNLGQSAEALKMLKTSAHQRNTDSVGLVIKLT